MLPLVFSLLLATGSTIDVIPTRCATETIRAFGNADSKEFEYFDVRRFLACGDALPEETLWQLDRLESSNGTLDGRFTRQRVHALVYVLDSGVEADHDEFADGNVIAGLDLPRLRGERVGCAGSSNEALHPCFDPTSILHYVATGHGTGVASVIGGRHVGVAPGVSIVSVLVRGTAPIASEGRQWIEAFNAVIRHAWDPATPQVPTAIINMSSQLAAIPENGDVPRAQVEQKIRDMVAGVDANGNADPGNGKRFLFVVAAGNALAPRTPGAVRGQCGPNFEVQLYPATLGPAIRGLITVGGTTKANGLWPESCRGPAVELLAPAEDAMPAINSARDHYRKTLSSGTSYSAPIVAGVAAHILTLHPELTPAELEERLESTPSYVTDAPPGTTGRQVFVSFAPRRRMASQ